MHTDSNDRVATFLRHVAQTSDAPVGLVVDRAEGPWLFTADGRQILDLISGIAVSSIGHRHPSVVKAIRAQLDRHLHVMVYGEFVLRPQVDLARALASHLPDSLSVTYFTNSGTEAVEGSLKLAKKHTGRSRLVAFDRSYHGDTHGSLSVTGRSVYRTPFLPLLPDVVFLPFNDAGPLDAIDERVAAVIVEPIQGEGGVRVPDEEWLLALRRRCTDAGAMLIFDEIQTGMGRTGKLFAFEHSGVVPDILCLAKALGGGLPLGAFVSSPEVMRALRTDPPLNHVTTFGGNPLSCASALAALQTIVNDRLPGRAVEIEKRVRDRLTNTVIEVIRGRGAMLGLLLPDAVVTERFVSNCLRSDLLLGWTLHSDRLVRFAPPLNIPFDILDRALDVMVDVLESLSESTND